MLKKALRKPKTQKTKLGFRKFSLLAMSVLFLVSLLTGIFPATQKSSAYIYPGTVRVSTLSSYCATKTVLFKLTWDINPVVHTAPVEVYVVWGDGSKPEEYLVPRTGIIIPHEYAKAGKYSYIFEVSDTKTTGLQLEAEIVVGDVQIHECKVATEPTVILEKKQDEKKPLNGVYQAAVWEVRVRPESNTQRIMNFQYYDGQQTNITVPADPSRNWKTYTLTHAYPLFGAVTNVNGVNQRNLMWSPLLTVNNSSGKAKTEQASVLTNHMDEYPPTKPTDLNVKETTYSSNQMKVKLEWTNSRDDNIAMQGYNIFRNNQKVGFLYIGAGTVGIFTSSYIDTLPFPLTSPQTYQVQGIDGAGNVSELSDPVVIPPAGNMTLSKVYSNPNCGYCTADALAWTPPDGPTPIAYRIYVQSEGDYSDPNPAAPCSAAGTYLVETVATTTFTTRNAPCGLADGFLFGNWIFNYYYVVPVYSWGAGPASNSVYAAWMTYYQETCC